MKNHKATVALAATAILFSGNLCADYEELGSAAEVRDGILHMEEFDGALAACKDGKCSMPPKKKRRRAEDEDEKTDEGSCGEGTCG